MYIKANCKHKSRQFKKKKKKDKNTNNQELKVHTTRVACGLRLLWGAAISALKNKEQDTNT
jgi:hypothetical protein